MPHNTPAKRLAYQRRHRKKHAAEYAQYQVDYRLSGRKRDSDMKRLFGISEEQYQAMLKAQKGVCAICAQPEQVSILTGKPRRLAVDHDHETKRVRSLLCANCNSALGLFKENPSYLSQAIVYLAKFKGEESQ
jgi:hypothetical protein